MGAATALSPTQDPKKSPLAPKARSQQSPLAGLQAEAATAKASAAEAEKNVRSDIQEERALKPPELADPPQPQQTTPAQAWGSTAMLIAALGGLMTRTHASTALNAAAGVMNAFHQGDVERANQEFQRWKASNDNMQKMFQFQLDRLDKDIKLWQEDEKLGQVAYDIDAKTFGMNLQYVKTLDDAKRTQAEMMRASSESAKTSAELPMLYARNKIMYGLMQTPEFKGAGAQGQLEMINAAMGKGDLAMPVSPDQQQSYGSQVATGEPVNQIIPGYGKANSLLRNQAREWGIQNIMAANPGMSYEDAGFTLAERQAEYAAKKKSIGQLETMAGATTQARSQLDFNIDQATAEMKKLQSSDVSPIVNAIARGEEKWTGDPAYAGLFYYMSAAAVESARLQSGAQASTAQLHQGAMDKAEEWSNINLTPASWAEVARDMKAEGSRRALSYQQAINSQLQSMRGGASGGPKPGQVVDGWRFKGGDPSLASSWEKVK